MGRRAFALFCVLAAGVAAIRAGADINPQDINWHVVPQDAIPALILPKYESPAQVKYLQPDDRIIALRFNGHDLAYPTRILNHHEIVNDAIGGAFIVVTYCPLCGSAAAFDPSVNGRDLVFGVSGDLYDSNLLMYDHETDSLWVQVTGTAVFGKLKGARLREIPVAYDTWSHWKAEHPAGEVLAIPGGYGNRYRYDGPGAYYGYSSTQALWFAVSHLDARLPNKTRVLGVEVRGTYKAYPESLIRESTVIHDDVGGTKIALIVDRAGARLGAFREDEHRFTLHDGIVTDERGSVWTWDNGQLTHGGDTVMSFPVIPTFWFVWGAMHPNSEIYQ